MTFLFKFIDSGFLLTLGLILLISGGIMLYCYRRLNLLEKSVIEHGKILHNFILNYNVQMQNLGMLNNSTFNNSNSNNDNNNDNDNDNNNDNDNINDNDNNNDNNDNNDTDTDDHTSKKINLKEKICVSDEESENEESENEESDNEETENEESDNEESDIEESDNEESDNEESDNEELKESQKNKKINLNNELENSVEKLDFQDIQINNDEEYFMTNLPISLESFNIEIPNNSKIINLENNDQNNDENNENNTGKERKNYSKMRVDDLKSLVVTKNILDNESAQKMKKSDLVTLLQKSK